MKTRTMLLGALVVVIGAGGAYYAYQRISASSAEQAAAAADKDKPQVRSRELRFPPNAPQLAYIRTDTVTLVPEPVLEPFNGRLAYDENYTVRVSSPIAGRVTRLLAKPGDEVKAGQPLALLDAPEFSGARADVAKGEADLALKRKNLERARTLHEAGVMARKEMEAAETELHVSEAEAQRGRARLRNLTQPGAAAGDGYTLRAPISGIVTERNLNSGAEVRPDAPSPLFVITDPAHLAVIIDLPERDLRRIKRGQILAVDVDAYRGESFGGKVEHIGEVLDPVTHRVQVKSSIDNGSRRLKPEMFARVTVFTEANRPVARIPTEALISEGLYTSVFVELQPGVFEKRRVDVPLQGRSYSYVREGLGHFERVVSSGALLLNSEMEGGP
jgi:cobalt-zinc-cadmium efflux system membrane fusion protein